jgi:anti-sigma factor RsiW
MHPRTIELIHGDIDGELSAGEAEELRGLLASSADARREHERLRKFNDLLAGLPTCDPPAGLRDVILANIQRSAAASPPRPAYAPGRRHSRLGLVAALAATVAGVVLLLQRDDHLPELDPATLAGTFARPAAGRDAAVLRFDEPGVSGSIRLLQSAQGLFIEADLEADGPITLEARIDGRPLVIEGLVPIDSAPASTIRVGDGIRLLHSGKHHYAIVLQQHESRGTILELAVYEGERLIGEARLDVSRQNPPGGG